MSEREDSRSRKRPYSEVEAAEEDARPITPDLRDDATEQAGAVNRQGVSSAPSDDEHTIPQQQNPVGAPKLAAVDEDPGLALVREYNKNGLSNCNFIVINRTPSLVEFEKKLGENYTGRRISIDPSPDGSRCTTPAGNVARLYQWIETTGAPSADSSSSSPNPNLAGEEAAGQPVEEAARDVSADPSETENDD